MVNTAKWSDGPDKLIPTNEYTTTKLSGFVKLRSSDRDMSMFPPISIYTMFKGTVEKKPHHCAMSFKPDKTKPWVNFSYEEYWKISHKAAKSFIKV
jgi:hypothetical protein